MSFDIRIKFKPIGDVNINPIIIKKIVDYGIVRESGCFYYEQKDDCSKTFMPMENILSFGKVLNSDETLWPSEEQQNEELKRLHKEARESVPLCCCNSKEDLKCEV